MKQLAFPRRLGPSRLATLESCISLPPTPSPKNSDDVRSNGNSIWVRIFGRGGACFRKKLAAGRFELVRAARWQTVVWQFAGLFDTSVQHDQQVPEIRLQNTSEINRGLEKMAYFGFHGGSLAWVPELSQNPYQTPLFEEPTMSAPIAVVLAAGKGTRMKSDLPKVLCQANGRPLVEYVLDSLREAGVEKIVVVVGYKADDVKKQLASYDNLEFALQTEQLGTGHAVMMCRENIGSHDGGIVVVAGDSPMLQSASVKALLDEYQSTKPGCVLGSLLHENPTGLGRIVRDGDGKFTGIVEEKDATDEQRKINEVNMSTYVFDGQKLMGTLDRLGSDNSQNEYYITDVPAIMLSDSEDVRALPVLKPIEALSVNTVEHLAAVEQAMNEQSAG